ncbi:hypothetical protein K461DRAFT_264060 [Myriangium duriaei CBS 260.36]|uniref:Uncharacterized protein n=1 Tax=Myriangium duriaei CBS 260.36 TaxID=1168546 RepID=A0A9P4JCG8_9PEZI|nr:hypothetical protein K461DRAFT_264060 [Myriangium duriaei CBS 260.36]
MRSKSGARELGAWERGHKRRAGRRGSEMGQLFTSNRRKRVEQQRIVSSIQWTIYVGTLNDESPPSAGMFHGLPSAGALESTGGQGIRSVGCPPWARPWSLSIPLWLGAFPAPDDDGWSTAATARCRRQGAGDWRWHLGHCRCRTDTTRSAEQSRRIAVCMGSVTV